MSINKKLYGTKKRQGLIIEINDNEYRVYIDGIIISKNELETINLDYIKWVSISLKFIKTKIKYYLVLRIVLILIIL